MFTFWALLIGIVVGIVEKIDNKEDGQKEDGMGMRNCIQWFVVIGFLIDLAIYGIRFVNWTLGMIQ